MAPMAAETANPIVETLERIHAEIQRGNLALREEIGGLRGEVRDGHAALREEMRRTNGELRSEIRSTNIHLEALERVTVEGLAELQTELRGEMRTGFAAVTARIDGLRDIAGNGWRNPGKRQGKSPGYLPDAGRQDARRCRMAPAGHAETSRH